MRTFYQTRLPFGFFTLCFVVLSILCTALRLQICFGQTSDWPQFRGPRANPTGDALNLPSDWNPKENLQWSRDIPGRGWSCPVVSGNKVFITTVESNREPKAADFGTTYSNDYVAELTAEGLSGAEINRRVQERDFEMPSDLSLTYWLYCIDLLTGQEIWKQKYYEGQPPGGRHRKNSFASETPVTDGQRIYIYAANLGLFAFDFSGEMVWKQELSNYPIYFDFGTGSSPIVVEGRLIILNDNEQSSFIAAYDCERGDLLWETKRGEFAEGERPLQASGWTTPLLWKNSLRSEIVTIGPGRVVSYDLEGNELWFMKGIRPGPAASPLAVGDQLIVNAGAPQPVYSIGIGAEGEISIADSEYIQWTRPRASTYIPTPLAYQGGLYLINDNGILTRLDLATGTESYKRRIKPSGADFTASPWAYADRIFLASEQGDVFVVKAGEEFELLKTIPMEEMIMATPALTNQGLILRTEKSLMAIGEKMD